MLNFAKDAINSVLNPLGIGVHRIDRLTSLANRTGSDKGNQKFHCHYYTRIYKHLLAPFEEKPIRLLEIGLLHPDHTAWISGSYLTKIDHASASQAPSLEMWASYFPQAEIFGLDLNDFSTARADRYKIFRGDAGSRADLNRFVEVSGGEFDVIIDDASHASHHQQIALGVLFPHVRPGGLFIIEDLSWQPSSIEPPNSTTTQSLLRHLETNGTFPSQFITDRERTYLETNVDTVALYDSNWDGLRGRDALGAIWKTGRPP
jgi:hypothetical protein